MMEHDHGAQNGPGWLSDPDRPGMERFWDGHGWTTFLRQIQATRTKIRNQSSIGVTAGTVLALVGMVAFFATPVDAATAVPQAEVSSSPSATTSQKIIPSPSPTPPPTPTTSTAQRTPTPTTQPTRKAEPTRRPTPSKPAKPASSKPAQPKAAPGTALAAAQTLAVKGRAAKTGYDRALFGPAWRDTDQNGCDQRNDVLRRDLQTFKTRSGSNGCSVSMGTLNDKYTGRTIAFKQGSDTSRAVQIDHVVALSDAWQKGAQQWPVDKRESFANDFVNLVAVDGPTNASKGDGDAATWLPPNKKYRCAYVARQVAVKTSYGVWVTKAEKAATVRILTTCPDQKLPKSSAAPAPDRATEEKPKPDPQKAEQKRREQQQERVREEQRQQEQRQERERQSEEQERKTRRAEQQESSNSQVVHPGSFCAPEGATGVTKKGTPMTCTTTSTDDRARWRSS